MPAIACNSAKKQYKSRQHAIYDARCVADKADRAHRNTHTEVYRCRQCQSWHVGSMANKKTDPAVRRADALRYEIAIDTALAG